MTFEVAIPTYARPQQVHDLTLATLAAGNVPADRVTLFVADDAQRAIYEARLPSGWPGRLVVGGEGIRAQRNVIHDHYPAGTRVLVMDDDVRRVYQMDDRRQQVDLAALSDDTFGMLEAQRLHLCGVYPTDQPFWMSRLVSADLRPVIGTLYWHIARPGALPPLTVEDAEDVEFTVLNFLRDGAVLRRNDVGLITRFRTEPGGLQVLPGRPERIEAGARALADRWPYLVTAKPGYQGLLQARLVRPRA